MTSPSTSIQGERIGVLSAVEKDTLLQGSRRTLKAYKYTFIVSCCLCFLVLPIVFALAFYQAMKEQQKKVTEIENHDLEVYQVRGTLRRKLAGSGRYGTRTYLYVYRVDDFLLPQTLAFNADQVLRQYEGQPVIAEYIPAVSKNRSVINSQGRGYNLITDQIL